MGFAISAFAGTGFYVTITNNSDAFITVRTLDPMLLEWNQALPTTQIGTGETVTLYSESNKCASDNCPAYALEFNGFEIESDGEMTSGDNSIFTLYERNTDNCAYSISDVLSALGYSNYVQLDESTCADDFDFGLMQLTNGLSNTNSFTGSTSGYYDSGHAYITIR